MVSRLDITRRYHERLLEVIKTALPFLTSSMRDADLIGLTHLREEMAEAMGAYCRHVHHLRDGARDAREAAALSQAEALVTGCVSLHAAYDAFRSRWAHRHAVEHWPEYRLSAIVMMKQVRNHVQHAERLRAAQLPLAA